MGGRSEFYSHSCVDRSWPRFFAVPDAYLFSLFLSRSCLYKIRHCDRTNAVFFAPYSSEWWTDRNTLSSLRITRVYRVFTGTGDC